MRVEFLGSTLTGSQEIYLLYHHYPYFILFHFGFTTKVLTKKKGVDLLSLLSFTLQTTADMCLPNNDSKFKSNGYFSFFTYLIWQSLKILIIFFLKTPNFLATVCPILFSFPLLIKQDIYPPVFFFFNFYLYTI